MATIVEGNPKAPFSIATTPRCRGGHYSFPGLLYFTLDPYLIMLSVKQGGIQIPFFESLVWLDLGLNPGLSGHWPAKKIFFYEFSSLRSNNSLTWMFLSFDKIVNIPNCFILNIEMVSSVVPFYKLLFIYFQEMRKIKRELDTKFGEQVYRGMYPNLVLYIYM